MKKHGTLLFFGLALIIGVIRESKENKQDQVRNETTLVNQIDNEQMKLGAFSISLNVKDLKVSKAFYENLGFEVFGGDIAKNYLIMKNDNSLIGLFQGMFENNIITFNPGWDESAKNVDPFNDVREIHQDLKEKGLAFVAEPQPNTTGPAHIILTDPDGNTIFIDQHR